MRFNLSTFERRDEKIYSLIPPIFTSLNNQMETVFLTRTSGFFYRVSSKVLVFWIVSSISSIIYYHGRTQIKNIWFGYHLPIYSFFRKIQIAGFSLLLNYHGRIRIKIKTFFKQLGVFFAGSPHIHYYLLMISDFVNTSFNLIKYQVLDLVFFYCLTNVEKIFWDLVFLLDQEENEARFNI
jgi:hypothetical protein